MGCSPVARHYWGNHCCFLLLQVLRCFSSLRSPPRTVARIITLQVIGLSHSEIAGSRVICTYPALIAAYRVLHRLREPRHPPCALTLFSHNSEDTVPNNTIKKRRHRKQQDGVTLILILCLFCRSMSKNAIRLRTPTVSGTGLTSSILFLTNSWRITDSNR